MAAAAGKDGARSLSDVIYLYVADGLGVGVISGGRLVVGSRGLGGEIEHMPLGLRNYGCYCGQRGCVETELSEKGFLRKWAEAFGSGSSLADGPGSGLAVGRFGGSAPRGEWKDFLAALVAGDEAARAVASENGRLLGRLISVLVNIFDPEVVYVGGIVGDFFETIRPEVESELGLRMVAGGLRKVAIESDADYRAMVLRGCAARAFSEWRI
jgi:predicted NBD/HSP70 family sugar kinase